MNASSGGWNGWRGGCLGVKVVINAETPDLLATIDGAVPHPAAATQPFQ
jgi:hypothetical protein